MNYNTIYNWPDERRRVFYPYVYWYNAFTEIELENVQRYCEEIPLDRAKILDEKDEKDNAEIRRSNIRFIRHDPQNKDIAWIFEKFNGVITELNNQFYGFNLNGYESFQYTTYTAEEQGFYNWHMDTCVGPNPPENMQEPRKLSLSLLLNDGFEGGEFQVNTGSEDNPETVNLTKGTIVAFPSFIIHRVKPVLTGIRKSVVIWVTGPKFI